MLRIDRRAGVGLALLLGLTGPLAARQDGEEVKPKSSMRIHVQEEGGKLRYTLLKSYEFDDRQGLFEWLESDREAAGPVVLQADGDVPYEAVAALFQKLWDAGHRQIELAAADPHEEWWLRTLASLGKKRMVGYGWLSDHYVEQFGDRAAEFMWRDLDRALCEEHLYLALNLIENMPDQTNSKGESTYFAKRVKGVELSDEAVRSFVNMTWHEKEFHAPGQVAVDLFARIREKRALQFLVNYMNDGERELWDRFAATRAIQRLRRTNDFLSGAMGGWLIPPGDTPDTRSRFAKEQDTLNEWWEKAKKGYPPQLLPPPRR